MPVTTPKLPPPPRSPQKRSAFSVRVGAHAPPVRRHQVHADDVVRGPAPATGQVAEAAAERQSGDTGQRDEAEHGGKPVPLRLAIHVPQQAPRLRAGDLPRRIHPHAAHERHVQHQRAVGHREARDVVAAALETQQESCSRANWTPAMNVRRAQAAHDAAGRRSIMAFHTARDSSWPASPGTNSVPRNAARRLSSAGAPRSTAAPAFVRARTEPTPTALGMSTPRTNVTGMVAIRPDPR